MAASKLSIYNAAATRIGTRPFNTLSDNRPAKRIFDSIWDGGLPKRVLENGQWNNAIRTIESIYDPDYSMTFGYQYAHTKPDDWVRTVGLSISENVTPPLMDYEDEAGFWFADYDVLYIRYVSSNIAFGGDLSTWPESLVEHIECELAYRACRALTGSDELTEQLRLDSDRAKKKAKSIDQMNQAPRKPPIGTWAASRLGGMGRFSGGEVAISVGASPVTSVSSGGAFSEGFSDAFA